MRHNQAVPPNSSNVPRDGAADDLPVQEGARLFAERDRIGKLTAIMGQLDELHAELDAPVAA